MTHSTPHQAPHDAPAHAHTHTHTHTSEADQPEMLDLGAEALGEHLAAIVRWLPVQDAPRRILDLGCGTGAGTFALLARFPEAHVTAVDSSAAHLDRLRAKADALGVADRVRTVHTDLDGEWPDLGTADLGWASASLHHLADPPRGLRRVHDTLAPGSLFAVVELAGFPRFLPEDAPADAPGLEERCHAVGDRHHAARMPHRGADWGPMLAAAGFTVEDERTLAVAIEGSRSPAVRRYALESLRRLRGSVADALSPGDLAAFDRLLDPEAPHGVQHRGDLTMRTERTVWAARR
ncbi:methyltransferase [Streptomyces mayteni]